MFCGSTGEVYEYDNHNWYHVPAIDPESDGDPGPLEGFAMAYYPPGGFTIVHGGKSPGTGNTMDESQWHWNGVSWEKVWVQTPVFDELIYRGHEGTRIGHELVYHEALERLFMIGGCFNSYDTDIYSCEAHQLANVGLNKCRTNEGLAPAHANLLGVAEQDLMYEFKEGGWTADVDGVIPNRVSVEEALEACLLEGEVRGGYHLPKVTYNPKAEKIVLWGGIGKNEDLVTYNNDAWTCCAADGSWEPLADPVLQEITWTPNQLLYFDGLSKQTVFGSSLFDANMPTSTIDRYQMVELHGTWTLSTMAQSPFRMFLRA